MDDIRFENNSNGYNSENHEEDPEEVTVESYKEPRTAPLRGREQKIFTQPHHPFPQRKYIDYNHEDQTDLERLESDQQQETARRVVVRRGGDGDRERRPRKLSAPTFTVAAPKTHKRRISVLPNTSSRKKTLVVTRSAPSGRSDNGVIILDNYSKR